jgi:hypothetical protein
MARVVLGHYVPVLLDCRMFLRDDDTQKTLAQCANMPSLSGGISRQLSCASIYLRCLCDDFRPLPCGCCSRMVEGFPVDDTRTAFRNA